LIPPDTAAEIRAFIVRLYAAPGPPIQELVLLPSDSAPGHRLLVQFDSFASSCAVLTQAHPMRDLVTRTHPKAFAAMLTQACAAGVTRLTISSAWRPSIGSIAHRSGLGLDVSHMDGGAGLFHLLRAKLRVGTSAVGGVTLRERELFAEYEELRTRKLALNKTGQQLTDEERETMTTKHGEWVKEKAAHEPVWLQRFRSGLAHRPEIAQIFDPWLMDDNVHDSVHPQDNEQRTANEILHSNHLHITIKEDRL
jgi:hypothetical protein